MTLVLQTFAAVFAMLGVFGMFTKRTPPASVTRLAPAATLVLALGLLTFAVALRDGWVDVPH
jgi:predicted small integral membrane protein